MRLSRASIALALTAVLAACGGGDGQTAAGGGPDPNADPDKDYGTNFNKEVQKLTKPYYPARELPKPAEAPKQQP